MGGGLSKKETEDMVKEIVQGELAKDSSTSTGVHFLEVHATSAYRGAGILTVGFFALVGIAATVLLCLWGHSRWRRAKAKRSARRDRRDRYAAAVELRELRLAEPPLPPLPPARHLRPPRPSAPGPSDREYAAFFDMYEEVGEQRRSARQQRRRDHKFDDERFEEVPPRIRPKARGLTGGAPVDPLDV